MWNAPCLIVGGKFHQPFFVFLQLLLTKHTNKFYVTSAWTFIIFLKFLFSFISSVQSLSCVQLFATPWLQHTRLPCPSRSPRVCSNSCPLSHWCLPTISSSVAPFSFRLQSFLASESFPMSHLFTSSGQSIGVSASVLLVNIQGWFPLGLTGLISLQSKGLSRVFANTIVQKHQFFSAQPSLWSNYYIHTWLLGKP